MVQLVKRKIWIEADPNFNGSSTRVLAYATVETDDGFVISDISIRQDIDNPTDIRVVFPFRKLHEETVPYIKFTSDEHKKKVTLDILNTVKSSINDCVNFR